MLSHTIVGAPLPARPETRWAGLCVLVALLVGCATPPGPGRAFRIHVIDQHTGRGIPAVELRTNDARSFYTDSAGMIALFEPDLFGRTVFFRVSSFGYRFAEELFGVRGTTLPIRPGGSVVLPMFRENVAERYYRVTGSGIYRDSHLLGDPGRLPERPLPPPSMGMDSTLSTVYRGRLFWVWGDTRVFANPLGNLRVSAATSELPGQGGLDPARGVALRYFRNGEVIRPMVDSDHPVVWLGALRVAMDAQGQERLFATYRKMGRPMRTLEVGLAEFDDEREKFALVQAYPEETPIVPDGHVFRVAGPEGTYLHYDLDIRSPADVESIRSIDRYEAFTPLRSGARLEDGADALERDSAGRLVWGWKPDAPSLTPSEWADLVADGHVNAREAWYRLIDVETGQSIVPHNGSVQWSPYRRRFIMIRSQIGGDSFLGEVFYGEADTPLGPWAYVQRIVTHARSTKPQGPEKETSKETLTFYNPVHHPELDRNEGRQIFFDGTLSTMFSGGTALPGYDYNPLMYALDLEDPRLYLPVAIYRERSPDGGTRYRPGRPTGSVAFFAPDRPREGTVAVREIAEPGARHRLVPETSGPDEPHGATTSEGPIRFYCAVGASEPGTVPLYEHRANDDWLYTTQPVPGADPVCHVWPAPVDFPAAVTIRTDAADYADAASTRSGDRSSMSSGTSSAHASP